MSHALADNVSHSVSHAEDMGQLENLKNKKNIILNFSNFSTHICEFYKIKIKLISVVEMMRVFNTAQLLQLSELI